MTIRELARNASRVVADVARTGRPALITKRGQPVADLVPVDERDLEDMLGPGCAGS